MNLFETLAHPLHTEWIYLSALFAAGLLILAGFAVQRAVAGESRGVVETVVAKGMQVAARDILIKLKIAE